MAFKTINYLNEEGKLSKTCKHKIPDKKLVEGYKIMELTHQLNDRMITLQRQGIITFAMSARGEEACAVASAAALSIDDWMFPQYRENGFILWRGQTVQEYIHHMFSNSEDIILGRQMPNHFGSRKLNVVTVSSPLSTQIPHAAGTAYAMKLQKQKAVSICFFGEGAASKGDFHSGLNFAATKKAPAIFFCRNNGYAISTSLENQYASDGIAPRGEGYGIKTFRIDGNDYFAIHETVSRAKKHCLEGKGPVLIEAMTYRLGAHSTSDDPSAYRTAKEVKKWEKKCPILRLRKHLESKKLWNEKKESNLQTSIKKEIDEAIEVAKRTTLPPPESVIEDVYFEVPAELKSQLKERQPTATESSLCLQ